MLKETLPESLNGRDERLIQSAQKSRPEQPKCPSCKHAPLEFHCNVVQTPMGHIVSVIWCGHCGHTLEAHFVGVQQPQIQPPGPMIVRPS